MATITPNPTEKQYREVMTNADMAFFLIPKCCSTTLRETLPGYGFERKVNGQIEQMDRMYAVCRNPLERFLSAFITLQCLADSRDRRQKDLLGDFVYLIFRMRNGDCPDIHYAPQADYVEGYDVKYLRFPYFSDDWRSIGTDINLPVLNRCRFPKELEIVEDYLNRHWELAGIIKKFYQKDYRLWQHANNSG